MHSVVPRRTAAAALPQPVRLRAELLHAVRYRLQLLHAERRTRDDAGRSGDGAQRADEHAVHADAEPEAVISGWVAPTNRQVRPGARVVPGLAHFAASANRNVTN